MGLVFPLDLKNVKKVGGRGVDLDEVLVILLRDGVWEIRHAELLGRLLNR